MRVFKYLYLLNVFLWWQLIKWFLVSPHYNNFFAQSLQTIMNRYTRLIIIYLDFTSKFFNTLLCYKTTKNNFPIWIALKEKKINNRNLRWPVNIKRLTSHTSGIIENNLINLLAYKALLFWNTFSQNSSPPFIILYFYPKLNLSE